MAEASKCPYCYIGTPLWIYDEKQKSFILQCSFCDARGKYEKPIESASQPAHYVGKESE